MASRNHQSVRADGPSRRAGVRSKEVFTFITVTLYLFAWNCWVSFLVSSCFQLKDFYTFTYLRKVIRHNLNEFVTHYVYSIFTIISLPVFLIFSFNLLWLTVHYILNKVLKKNSSCTRKHGIHSYN